MNYLFFDIECANSNDGAKLCEFGYVITNEKFEKITQKNILINPAAPFDEFVIKSLLNYKKEEYDNSPLLPAVYDEIFLCSTATNISSSGTPLREMPNTLQKIVFDTA